MRDAQFLPTAMSDAGPILIVPLRINDANLNHHLWNNNGTWFLHYTVYPTPHTKERIRRSLGTKQIKVARERRDRFFGHLSRQPSVSAQAVVV